MQTTINISLDVPQSYQLDTLKQELTEYAKKLVAKAKPKAKAENEAKYWLEPNIELAENFGFNTKELSFIEEILKDYGDDFKIKFARHTGKRLDD